MSYLNDPIDCENAALDEWSKAFAAVAEAGSSAVRLHDSRKAAGARSGSSAEYSGPWAASAPRACPVVNGFCDDRLLRG